MATNDGMRMDMATAHSLAKRGYLTIEMNSLGSGWVYARIMCGTDAVWACTGHSHKSRISAQACADQQMKRIERSPAPAR